jgi:acetyl/propionyl-CoA carboxylase alpha subunit
VGTNFDSLIGKIIVRDKSLESCFDKLLNKTLNQATPFGLHSNTAFLIKLIEKARDYNTIHTKWIETSFLEDYNNYYKDTLGLISHASLGVYKNNFSSGDQGLFSKNLLRPAIFSIGSLELEVNGENFDIIDSSEPNSISLNDLYVLKRNSTDCIKAVYKGIPFTISPIRFVHDTNSNSNKGELDITAPLPGTIININNKEGDVVRAGTPLLSIESMKTEHKLSAKGDCIIESINIQLGHQAKKGEVLISCKPIPNEEKI